MATVGALGRDSSVQELTTVPKLAILNLTGMGFKPGACEQSGTFADKKIKGLIGLVAGRRLVGPWRAAAYYWLAETDRHSNPRNHPPGQRQPCIHSPAQRCSQDVSVGEWVGRRELPKAGDDQVVGRRLLDTRAPAEAGS
jgi:hypothetical protein